LREKCMANAMPQYTALQVWFTYVLMSWTWKICSLKSEVVACKGKKQCKARGKMKQERWCRVLRWAHQYLSALG
jgi:tmRNA-binding protein